MNSSELLQRTTSEDKTTVVQKRLTTTKNIHTQEILAYAKTREEQLYALGISRFN